uniref:Uncharacterized protein n=1 Tax=Hordeum vulgare subsp. vulgare TaxID=112509 RepID=A0A8I6X0C7_HORVV
MMLLWHWLQSCVAYLLTLSYPKTRQHVRLTTLSVMVVRLSGATSPWTQENLWLKKSRKRLVLFLFIHLMISIPSVVRVQYALNFWSKSQRSTQ